MCAPVARHAWCRLRGGGQLVAKRCLQGPSNLDWRRIFGAIFMVLGGGAVIAMIALASIIIANFVEPENAAEALSTVAMATLPMALLGTVVLGLGRWLYGGWTERAPVLHAASLLIRIAGFLVALGLGAMFLFLVFTGIGPDDHQAAAGLGLGAIAGLAIMFAGFLMRPKQDMP